jgi:DNA-binding cell septation regulator SpoVG
MKILDWRLMQRGALVGSAKIELPSGVIIHDINVMDGASGPWAAMPRRVQVDRNGVALRDSEGRVKYAPIIEFATRELRDRFSSEVIAALRAAHPEALT